MKKLGYLGFSMIPGAVLSLAVISGCNSEEAPPATPPAATAPAAPEGGPKMEPAAPPAGDAAPKPADAKK